MFQKWKNPRVLDNEQMRPRVLVPFVSRSRRNRDETLTKFQGIDTICLKMDKSETKTAWDSKYE